MPDVPNPALRLYRFPFHAGAAFEAQTTAWSFSSPKRAASNSKFIEVELQVSAEQAVF